MAGPHSHPGYRERGVYTQKQWDAIKAQKRAEEQAKWDEWARANPEDAAKVEARCASMITELEAGDEDLDDIPVVFGFDVPLSKYARKAAGDLDATLKAEGSESFVALENRFRRAVHYGIVLGLKADWKI